MNYSCIYYKKIGKYLFRNRNTACWAGLVNTYQWRTPNQYESKKIGSVPSTIYIDTEFIYNENIRKENIQDLLNIINKITECSLETINGKDYIKYKLAFNKDYNANLLLLNFIRTLWYHPLFNIKKFLKDISEYDNSDPFLYLTTSLKNNSINNKSYGVDHSNISPNIIPKTTKDIYDNLTYIKNNTTNRFLRNEC